MTLQTLLNDVTAWQIDAGALIQRRTILLARARKLRMTAAVKSLLAVPRVGEPEAAEPPGPFPTGAAPILADPVAEIVAGHQDGPLAIPAHMRRK